MSGDDFNIKYRFKGKNRSIAVRGPHDYSTFFEVYCRRDYKVKSPDSVVLDIGSNIGITARYFLENAAEFIYLYEPNLENLNLLRMNIEEFAGRYVLAEKAIAISSGTSTFEFDGTGRYGRLVDVKNPEDGIPRQRTEVEAICIMDAIDAVFTKFNKIDILKIDIEGLEKEIVKAIPQNRLAKIKMIQYETWPKGIVTLEP
jgi:FkbM family methyltransferase